MMTNAIEQTTFEQRQNIRKLAVALEAKSMSDVMLNVHQAAKVVDVGDKTVLTWIAKGWLKGHKQSVGGKKPKLMVSRKALIEAYQQHKAAPPSRTCSRCELCLESKPRRWMSKEHPAVCIKCAESTEPKQSTQQSTLSEPEKIKNDVRINNPISDKPSDSPKLASANSLKQVAKGLQEDLDTAQAKADQYNSLAKDLRKKLDALNTVITMFDDIASESSR